MKFEVYCDESRPDLLSSQRRAATYMLIGSLWLRADKRQAFKKQLHELRDRHKVGGEFKWQKISPSRVMFYEEVVDFFCRQSDEDLRFRCIAVDQNKVDLRLYHDDDQELGFYKFYYQLLHHWILDCNEYAFFLDFKSTGQRDRLPILRQCLDRSNLSSVVARVQAIRSRESVLVQLVDVLTGAAAYRLNSQTRSESAKFAVVRQLERGLDREIAPTWKSEQKFNVFKIDLGGGW